MATHIQWNLYAKHESGYLLCKETACEIMDALKEHVTEWHSDAPDGDHIGSFLTTWNNGYESVTEAIAEYARAAPAILFRLECHNEDSDFYQHIHFHGDDREELDATILYEKPQRILYDAPEPMPQLMIVTQGGSVQGIFSEAIHAADVVIVDTDLSKLDAASEDERIDTVAWINKKLALGSSMNCLYGNASKEEV